MEEWFLRWWPVIGLLITVVFIPTGWAVIRAGLVPRSEHDEEMAAEAKARIEQNSELDRRLTSALAMIDRRLIQVETDIKHLPTSEDVGELKEQMSDVVAQNKYMTKEIDSISAALQRVEGQLAKVGGAR